MDPFRARLEQSLAGQYRFIRELGGGGMSRTYLADEPSLQRRVVVKVLAPEMLEGLSVERFKREVLLAASLQHPHVVPVLAAGDADGLPWFSMPYVDGDSLRQRLAVGPLGIDEAVGILRDVARALSYAHAHGVVHRDIKPDNVLLSAGSATVTDFGIAKAISASRLAPAGASLTQVGLAIGTPAYMAPEQAEGAADIDHRADLYAFGAMAFELLTGEAVFAAATPGRLLIAQMTEPPRDPRSLRRDIPAPLAELVLHCLAKLPGDRPADASALVRALDGSSARSSAAAPAVLAPIALPTVLVSWAGGSALLIGGVYVAATTVGVPAWAMPSAITLAAAGLPALLGAWWIQHTAHRVVHRTPIVTPGGTIASPGTMATLALRAQPHVTLRRTRRLGVIVGAIFALLVGGFMTTRAYGIGPAASLIGSGEFSERERVLVADFNPPATDSTLGSTVAEALRTDLAQSPNLAVFTRASVRDVLQRMQRPLDALVTFDLAREIATREGTKALIDGDVVRLGSSYVLSARLVSAVDGRELATFRETAQNDAELVPAVGKLSRSIREKVGESLKGLANAKALERVSTPSLAALRKYVDGSRLEDNGGDRARALQLLQEAVAIDSSFAMAWRKIAVMYTLLPDARAQALAAASTAYRHRERLSDDERDLTDALYFTFGPSPDPEKAAGAYEQLLARDSLNSTALNNLGAYYSSVRQYDKAMAMFLRAASLPRPSAVAVINLASLGSRRLNKSAVDSAVRLFDLRFPTNSRSRWEVTAWRLLSAGRSDSLAGLAREWADSTQSVRQASGSGTYLVSYETSRGRIGASLAASAARMSALARITKRAPQPLALMLDSSFAAALYDGDRSRTRATLQRMLDYAIAEAVPPAERPWSIAIIPAALAGDGAMATALDAAYRRDNAALSTDRAWEDARMAGQVALAKGQYQEAVSQLQRAGQRRTAPDVEESFLIAMAFDRAGMRDSAITWFARAVSPAEAGDGNLRFYGAAAERRLAELLDEKGDAAAAIQHYEKFATLWKDAEPARQPVVKAARERAAQLRTKKDPG